MVFSLTNWLSRADPLRGADAIFVLAGRDIRKQYGLELFRKGFASRILFSVGRFEIRRFSKMPLPVSLDLLKLAADVPPPERHYFVVFEGGKVQVEYVRPKRFGTLTEMEALARWHDKHPEVRSLVVVSSGPHLRRLRLCCRALLGTHVEVAFVAASGSSSSANEDSQNAAFLELAKLILYWILLKLRPFSKLPDQEFS